MRQFHKRCSMCKVKFVCLNLCSALLWTFNVKCLKCECFPYLWITNFHHARETVMVSDIFGLQKSLCFVLNPDRSWWHRHTNLKLFRPKSMSPCKTDVLYHPYHWPKYVTDLTLGQVAIDWRRRRELLVSLH